MYSNIAFEILINKPDDESGGLLYSGKSFGRCCRRWGTRLGRTSWVPQI